jgi:CheY-like chemotaxis protein
MRRVTREMTAATPIIVVVDDSQAVRVFFERIATNVGVDLRTYASAAEAMSFLSERRPDLLFLDIIMPEKDGLTFLQELRRMPLHESTPTIMISSKDYAQDRGTAKQLGVVEYLPKPMTGRAIQDAIVRYAVSPAAAT